MAIERLRILVVEDDELLRGGTGRKLARSGYEVAEVGSADDAISKLESAAAFDLIFTDIMMPGDLNGADLAREVLRRWPKIKLLVTSAETPKAREALNLPAAIPFLAKPYSSADLLSAIEAVLRA
jgi:CheY-like chemotaxis protein